MEQYKHVVDESAIVSKTDLDGVITYVNNQFCQISGYDEEELLGKKHSIVKHPDNKIELFKEIWNTIKKR